MDVSPQANEKTSYGWRGAAIALSVLGGAILIVFVAFFLRRRALRLAKPRSYISDEKPGLVVPMLPAGDSEEAVPTTRRASNQSWFRRDSNTPQALPRQNTGDTLVNPPDAELGYGVGQGKKPSCKDDVPDTSSFHETNVDSVVEASRSIYSDSPRLSSYPLPARRLPIKTSGRSAARTLLMTTLPRLFVSNVSDAIRGERRVTQDIASPTSSFYAGPSSSFFAPSSVGHSVPPVPAPPLVPNASSFYRPEVDIQQFTLSAPSPESPSQGAGVPPAREVQVLNTHSPWSDLFNAPGSEPVMTPTSPPPPLRSPGVRHFTPAPQEGAGAVFYTEHYQKAVRPLPTRPSGSF